jgi:hypothetical protein
MTQPLGNTVANFLADFEDLCAAYGYCFSVNDIWGTLEIVDLDADTLSSALKAEDCTTERTEKKV